MSSWRNDVEFWYYPALLVVFFSEKCLFLSTAYIHRDVDVSDAWLCATPALLVVAAHVFLGHRLDEIAFPALVYLTAIVVLDCITLI